MVLPQAMAWVQYWFRVLSLKFCGKSKKNCGDISQLSPAFCMYEGCDACWNHLTCCSGKKTGRSRFYLILDSSAFYYIGHLRRRHQLHGNLTIMAKYQLVKIFLVNAQKDSTPFVRVLPLAAHCHRNEVLFTITIKYECCITANPVMILWFGFEEEYDNGNDQTRVR